MGHHQILCPHSNYNNLKPNYRQIFLRFSKKKRVNVQGSQEFCWKIFYYSSHFTLRLSATFLVDAPPPPLLILYERQREKKESKKIEREKNREIYLEKYQKKERAHRTKKNSKGRESERESGQRVIY